MIRSLYLYGRYALGAGLNVPLQRLILSHQKRALPTAVPEPRSSLNAVVDHLLRCQEASGDAGFGSFHLVSGYGRTYPETTGYILPTLLAAAPVLQRPELVDHALRAAELLLKIQLPAGGWQGGRVGEARGEVVFNTAQVIRGMLAVHAHTGDARFLAAARRAGDRVCAVQEADGTWARHNFLGVARVYDTYVDAPLMALSQVTGETSYREAALRNLRWVLGRQQANGWFADADNTIKHNDRPITHTIAYTIDGLLECHLRGGGDELLHAARRAADPLRDRFLRDGVLQGRYDNTWRGSEAAITTGCAQLSIVWWRLYAITNEVRYKEAAEGMVQWLMRVQALGMRGPEGGRGAVTGSFPLWGRYEKFACPNWAQKYLADALLCSMGILPRQ
ncbi:MAG: hypothetical protein MUE88_07080 [Flavobacteriales bacterium]|nr:hypothetical protein [Flavobacteriales bacterium]